MLTRIFYTGGNYLLAVCRVCKGGIRDELNAAVGAGAVEPVTGDSLAAAAAALPQINTPCHFGVVGVAR